jgi:hypothetical protein
MLIVREACFPGLVTARRWERLSLPGVRDYDGLWNGAGTGVTLGSYARRRGELHAAQGCISYRPIAWPTSRDGLISAEVGQGGPSGAVARIPAFVQRPSPSPERSTCSSAEAPWWTVSRALRLPLERGVKDRLTEQELPGSRLCRQSLLSVKSLLFVPLTSTRSTLKVPSPEFSSLTVYEALLTPTAWLPNETAWGEPADGTPAATSNTVITAGRPWPLLLAGAASASGNAEDGSETGPGAGAMAIPVRLTPLGLPPASWLIPAARLPALGFSQPASPCSAGFTP